MEVALLQEPVLVLNRHWVAVTVAPVRRALTMVFSGRARVVNVEDYSTYDFASWAEASRQAQEDERRLLRTVRQRLLLPEVIVLLHFGRVFAQRVMFSRRNIFERDGNACQYCGRHFERSELTLDHVVPRVLGGHSTWENVVVACWRCNAKKADKTPQMCGMKLIRRPVKPKWASRFGVRVGRHMKPSWKHFLDAAYWDVELTD